MSRKLGRVLFGVVCAIALVAFGSLQPLDAGPMCPGSGYSSEPIIGGCLVWGNSGGHCQIGTLNCTWSCEDDGHGGQHPVNVQCSPSFCPGPYGVGCCGGCSYN